MIRLEQEDLTISNIVCEVTKAMSEVLIPYEIILAHLLLVGLTDAGIVGILDIVKDSLQDL